MEDILKKVLLGKRNPHYNYIVEQDSRYKAWVLGEGYAEEIYNYKPVETDEQKAERAVITSPRTPEAIGKLKGFMQGVFRPDKVKVQMEVDNDTELTAKLQNAASSYGKKGQTVLQWSEEVSLDKNTISPNSFHWVRYNELEQSFSPVLFDPSQVLYSEVNKGRVVSLVAFSMIPVDVIDGDKLDTAAISVYHYFYYDGEQAKLQVLMSVEDSLTGGSNYYESFKEALVGVETVNNIDYYIYEYDLPIMPVTDMGYISDDLTNKDSYVPFWNKAYYALERHVNDGSVLDVTKMKHLFPQGVEYYVDCDYSDGANTCNGGHLTGTNEVCPNCHGTGKQFLISGQEKIQLKLPEPGESMAVTPKDFSYYVELPLDVAKWQKTIVDEFGSYLSEIVFGVDISHQQQTGAPTATQVINYSEKAQDVLYAFTQAPVKQFEFTLSVMAAHLGIASGDALIELKYTNNFNLDTEQQLLMLLQKAKDAGASSDIMENINERLVNKQNRSNSNYMNVYREMRKFKPFADLGEQQRVQIIQSLSNSSTQRAIALNLNQITNHIISDQILNNRFLLGGYEDQKTIVDELAQNIIDSYSDEDQRGFGQIDLDIIDEDEIGG